MLTRFTDTDTDFNLEKAAEYGYKLISMPYSVDGKTVFPYVDFQKFDSHAFYQTLREGVIPTTSAVGADTYRQSFEPEFAAGNDILYVHFSRAMSASFDSMDKVVAELLEQYPDRKFYAIDTKGITIVSYLMAEEIADRLNAGQTPEEVVAWADGEVQHFAQYFFADNLKFFRRSGRVSGLAATMGGLIGLRPVINMNDEGKMVSVGTEKGRAKVMEKLVQTVEELGDDIKSYHFIIGHTDAPELASQLADMLRERFGQDLKIETVVTNPTAGSHCGPDGVGVAFHAKHR